MIKLRNVFKRQIEGLRELPTLPDSVEKIIEKIDQEASLTAIAKIIEEDQVVSARVLKLVNSAFYGRGGKISSLHHSISILGINILKGLVMGSYFLSIDDSGIEGLWAHASAVASLANEMGRHLSIKNVEEVAAAALLHDIGKLILREVEPDSFGKFLQYLEEDESRNFKDNEDQWFPASHEDAALMWVKRYNFPILIQEVVAFHHRPAVASIYKKEVSLVHLADAIVKLYGRGFSGDYSASPINKVALKHLELNESSLYDLILKSAHVLS